MDPNNLVFLVFGALLGIPGGVVANLLTPHYKDWRARRSRKSAQKRIEELEGELRTLESYVDQPNRLYMWALRQIILVLAMIPIIVVLAALGAVVAVLTEFEYKGQVRAIGWVPVFTFTLVALFTATSMALRTVGIIDHTIDYEVYKPNVEAKIEQYQHLHSPDPAIQQASADPR